jgi:hypothetical protein
MQALQRAQAQPWAGGDRQSAGDGALAKIAKALVFDQQADVPHLIESSGQAQGIVQGIGYATGARAIG